MSIINYVHHNVNKLSTLQIDPQVQELLLQYLNLDCIGIIKEFILQLHKIYIPDVCKNYDLETVQYCLDNMYKYWGVDLTDNILREHLPQICGCGDLFKVRCVMINITKRNPEKIDVEDTLYYACESGDIQLINAILKMDNDLNGGMLGACKGGHAHIVTYMINMTPKHKLNRLSYAYGFIEACKSGHIAIAEMMIRYISGPNKTTLRNWNKCFRVAQKINNTFLIKLVIRNATMPYDSGHLL